MTKANLFNPEFIVIHHSASERTLSVEAIRQYHISRGFDDIGYHKLIDFAGNLYDGRPLEIPGAHALGFNDQSIGICCIGNFEDEEPTTKMLNTLNLLLLDLCSSFNIEVDRIIGHFEVRNFIEAKSGAKCPGKNLRFLLSKIRKNVASNLAMS
ncbi:MAG: hypothetical protein GYA55_06645 [SAR324 cluster bacterium]|uniref:N-acetylmuramoyl-L-alanine amidase n=1 Tax=SAR324 cluster bacterium TaxID=2024889 RepID=A0A7X9IK57_9DELT|nr:hypothetical protein [SAR324 cluster bacterium]